MAVAGAFDFTTHQPRWSLNPGGGMHIASFTTRPTDFPQASKSFYCSLRSLCCYGMFGTIFFLVPLTGCNGSDAPPVSHGGPVRDHVSLVDTLRAQGLTVEPTGPISQPFFSVPGQTLRVNGQDIQVFEFENPSAARSQAKDISPDGMSISHTVVQWIDPPHFFLSGKILVLYLGTDQELFKKLETVLGKQIAGASS
jgi:hypothetical protein